MECIYSFLVENREECQFFLKELMDHTKRYFKPDVRTIKNHVEKRFGHKITLCEIGHGHSHQTLLYFCFKKTILYDNWYNGRRSNLEERLRVVKAVIEIRLRDIHSMIYDVSEYPSSDTFLQDAELGIPERL